MSRNRSASRTGRKKVAERSSVDGPTRDGKDASASASATTSVPIYRLPLEVLAAAQDTVDYERSLLGHYLFGTTFREGAQLYFQKRWEGDSEADGLRKRVQAFSLAQALLLWNEPHYRAPSYADDLSANLSNVAIPGTGVALSWVVVSRLSALLFLVLVHPVVCLLAGLNASGWNPLNLAAAFRAYRKQLCTPDDWFSFWRLNCRLVAWHWLATKSTEYDLENKWTFLQEGDRLGVPVSPFLKAPALFVKHRNMEGGMGIHFFRNATAGGDWIIQEQLNNSEFLASLLPETAPTSTFRVITASKGGLKTLCELDGGDGVGMDIGMDINDGAQGSQRALSCVLRAGRADAVTDHNAIPFDIDIDSGVLRLGRTNMHWYRTDLALSWLGGTPWTSEETWTSHPDSGVEVTGKTVPSFNEIRAMCEEAHAALCPTVPLVGWDAVQTTHGIRVCLLEANFSCNFFLGSFDRDEYFQFVADYFTRLEAVAPLSGTAAAEAKRD